MATIIKKLLRHVRIKLRNFVDFEIFEKRAIPPVRFEKISKSLAIRNLPLRPVIVDCGAYDGGDAITLAKLSGGTVHAFEADPEIFELLKHNTRRCASVRCHHLALSDRNGIGNFYCGDGDFNASGSLLEPNPELKKSGLFGKRVSVKLQTLESWMQENLIKQIDMLWLDMQGAELLMLKASVSVPPSYGSSTRKSASAAITKGHAFIRI
ncbi:MAG UNVERIFIED_CONTAM: FkbM family methyltransferase [Planctomycetaceae bacterium]|jgi:FkbM family methyltransferase